jgi:hypothetical protein
MMMTAFRPVILGGSMPKACERQGGSRKVGSRNECKDAKGGRGPKGLMRKRLQNEGSPELQSSICWNR